MSSPLLGGWFTNTFWQSFDPQKIACLYIFVNSNWFSGYVKFFISPEKLFIVGLKKYFCFMNNILYFINFWLRDKVTEKHSLFKIFKLHLLHFMIYSFFLFKGYDINGFSRKRIKLAHFYICRKDSNEWKIKSEERNRKFYSGMNRYYWIQNDLNSPRNYLQYEDSQRK